MPTLTLNSAREAVESMIDDKNMIVMNSFFIVFPSFSTDIPFKRNISSKNTTYFPKIWHYGILIRILSKARIEPKPSKKSPPASARCIDTENVSRSRQDHNHIARAFECVRRSIPHELACLFYCPAENNFRNFYEGTAKFISKPPPSRSANRHPSRAPWRS